MSSGNSIGPANGPVAGAGLRPAIAECESATRKIYINGVEIDNVHELNVSVSPYGGQSISISLNPKNVKITEESIFIDQDKPKSKRYTKKQLRDLLVQNLDNMEAITWIKKLKLNGR